MAEYPIFSQPQGPQIDVSLFPDAMRAGAQVGNMVKTPLQAVAEGISQGIQNYQTTALKQAQVENIPVEQEIKRQQMEQEQLQTQMQQVQTQAAVLNQSKIIDNQAAQLDDSTAKLRQDKQLRDDTEAVKSTWNQTDNPLDKKKILFSGQYADVFANNDKLYRQFGTDVYQFMTPQEQRAFDAGLQKRAISNAYDSDLQKWQIESQHTKSTLYSDPDFVNATDAAGMTPEQAEGQLIYKQHGSVAVDPNTRKVQLGKSGWVYNKPGSYDPKDSTWDVFTPDGRLVKEGASSDSGKAFNLNRRAQNYVNGNYRQQALSQVDARMQPLAGGPAQQSPQQQVQPRQQPAPVNNELHVPTLSGSKQAPMTPEQTATATKEAAVLKIVDPKIQNLGYIRDINVVSKGVPVLANNPDAYEVARVTVGVNKDNFKEIRPEFKTIFSALELPKTGYLGRRSVENEQQIWSAKQQISNKLSDLEFKHDPGLKETYNDAAVEDHNARADFWKQFIKSPSALVPRPMDVLQGNASLSSFLDPMGSTKNILADMVPVNTPEELYRLKNVGKHDEVVNRIVDEFDRKIIIDKRSALKNKATPQAMLEILNEETPK